MNLLTFQASPQIYNMPCDSACKYLKQMKIKITQAHLMLVWEGISDAITG